MQAGGERVGEAAVRRDGEDRRAGARGGRVSHWRALLRSRAIDGGRADVEPQPLVDRAEAAAFLDRAVPQDVGREGAFGRVAEQALRDDLDAGEDERRDARRAAAAEAAGGVHVEVADAR